MPYFRSNTKRTQEPTYNRPAYGMKFNGLSKSISTSVRFSNIIYSNYGPLSDIRSQQLQEQIEEQVQDILTGLGVYIYPNEELVNWQYITMAIDDNNSTYVAFYDTENINISVGTHLFKLNSDGKLDESWAENGIKSIPATLIKKVHVDSNGNLYLLGIDSNSMVAIKLDNNGIHDMNWGTSGTTSLDVSGSDTYTSSILVNDTSLYISGYSFTNEDYCIFKLNPSGALDPTWGNSGVNIVDGNHNTNDVNNKILLDSNNNLYLVGEHSNPHGCVIFKFDPTGTLDPTWGTSGKTNITPVNTSTLYIVDALVNSNNEIYIFSYCDSTTGTLKDVYLFKLNTSGALDLTWGNNGINIFDGNNTNDRPRVDLILDSNDNLYILVFLQFANPNITKLMKYDSQGVLDPTWGNSINLDNVMSISFYSNSLYIIYKNIVINKFVIMKVKLDGQVDTSWGDSGICTLPRPDGYSSNVFSQNVTFDNAITLINQDYIYVHSKLTTSEYGTVPMITRVHLSSGIVDTTFNAT